MLKRLARILIILIILVGLYRYTSIFDNTKIKPYLENINNGIANLFSKSGSSNKTTIKDSVNTTGQGVTGASAFNDNDVIDFRTSSNSNSQTNSTGSTEMRNSGIEAKILDIKLSDLNQSSSKFPNGCVTPRGLMDNKFLMIANEKEDFVPMVNSMVAINMIPAIIQMPL